VQKQSTSTMKRLNLNLSKSVYQIIKIDDLIMPNFYTKNKFILVPYLLHLFSMKMNLIFNLLELDFIVILIWTLTNENVFFPGTVSFQ